LAGWIAGGLNSAHVILSAGKDLLASRYPRITTEWNGRTRQIERREVMFFGSASTWIRGVPSIPWIPWQPVRRH
jgi:hypothetical protein